MKIGDKIYAHSSMHHWIKKGNTYTITNIYPISNNEDIDQFEIIDEDNDYIALKFRDFNHFFYTNQDIRRKKLKKLNDLSI
jgi:hypothetical protein